MEVKISDQNFEMSASVLCLGPNYRGTTQEKFVDCVPFPLKYSRTVFKFGGHRLSEGVIVPQALSRHNTEPLIQSGHCFVD